MAVSGLRTSCATPAASVPKEATGLKITERAERSALAGHAHGAYLLRTNCTEKDPAKL